MRNLQIADGDATVQELRVQSESIKPEYERMEAQEDARLKEMDDWRDILLERIPFHSTMSDYDRRPRKSDTPVQAQLRAEHSAKSDKQRNIEHRADQATRILRIALQRRKKNKNDYLWKLLEKVASDFNHVLTIKP